MVPVQRQGTRGRTASTGAGPAPYKVVGLLERGLLTEDYFVGRLGLGLRFEGLPARTTSRAAEDTAGNRQKQEPAQTRSNNNDEPHKAAPGPKS